DQKAAGAMEHENGLGVLALDRNESHARVLLTTFSKSLANALKVKIARLTDEQTAARIEVRAVTNLGYDLFSKWFGQPNIASSSTIQSLLTQAAKLLAAGQFSPRFLLGEWSDVVDAWQLQTWEDYRDVARLGRKTRIGGKQREVLWSIFAQVRAGLSERKMVTWAEVFRRVTERLASVPKPFDFAVVDEAQDVSVAEMRFLAALAGGRTDGLFLAGDLGQRIFQQPFSWKSLGVDVRGRSHTLRVCYRTSHQIRFQADRLLPDAVTDVDGNAESRKGTVSVFDGPVPRVAVCDDEDAEIREVSSWLMDLIEDGVVPDEIGVFVRSDRELRRARAALKASGIPAVELDDTVEVPTGHVAISTMHLAKGLEFRAVAVMACDDEVLPEQDRIVVNPKPSLQMLLRIKLVSRKILASCANGFVL
ncbi:UvrD-helicase domain-containing protein, partial [Magnetospirillum moscoviense]|uniref:UvrD-helicase domain-containing protein n=1 Tax=Magnetospirillum moscoviense TaxID=1437059 RepID=UPI000A780556